MQRGQFQMYLSPLDGTCFTRLRLSGVVPTAMASKDLQRLSAMLSFWSGYPVRLALPVDVATAAWFELWTAAFERVPARHLEMRFILARRPRTLPGER